MRYLSVCSGIEAATCAWHHMGWEPVAFSEIEKFPSAVLAHHYPSVPNWGDMTRFQEWPDANVDVLVGGTPCQSFSVAGLRKGLDDPRGNLMLTFGAIAQRYRPRWLVWENVPGVLSSNGGRDFGTFLGMLGELGYGFAYRVLDAQFFGVAQRRRRVFVVANARSWQRAAAVLFESHSLQGHPAPSREASKDVAGTFTARANSGGWGQDVDLAASGYMQVAQCLTARQRFDPTIKTLITPKVAETLIATDYKGPGHNRDHNFIAEAVAFPWQSALDPIGQPSDVSGTLIKNQTMAVQTEMQVRRLTPVERERLQGFPDRYTNIPWRKQSESPDGPRYKALGNSMAVPVMRWIGERINQVEAI